MIDFLKRLFGPPGELLVAGGERATTARRVRGHGPFGSGAGISVVGRFTPLPEGGGGDSRTPRLPRVDHLGDLVDVISRHVEVDRDKIEVNFERQDSALAMLANIPILSVGRPNGNPTLVPIETVQSPIVANGSAPRVRKRRKRAAKKTAPTSAAPASAAAQ